MQSAETPPDPKLPPAGSRRVERFVESFLRVPLFLKLLTANALIAALAAGAVVVLTPTGVGRATWTFGATVFAVFLGVLTVAGLLNAVVIRLALSPLVLMADTAERVRDGELDARVPTSPLADRTTRGLIDVFNRMLDAVQSGRRRQRELSRRVLEAEERERERIADELYAGPAQTLAGVLVRLRLSTRSSEERGMPHIHREIRDEVALALDEIRQLARRLHPPELGQLGIRPALEAHARKLTAERPIRVSFQGSVPDRGLSPESATALFRIVQEAITNAVHHSSGSTVAVRFQLLGDRVVARVSDDGRGFVTDPYLDASPSGPAGIAGMRERARYAGGQLSLEATPGGGSTVSVELPRTFDDSEQDLVRRMPEPGAPGPAGHTAPCLTRPTRESSCRPGS